MLFLRTGNRYNVNLNGTNQHKSSTNEWRVLERFRLHGVESDVTVRKKDYFPYIKEAVIVTLFLLMAQTSTNRAQTNGTGLDRFGRHGVESDVTAQNFFVISKKGKYI